VRLPARDFARSHSYNSFHSTSAARVGDERVGVWTGAQKVDGFRPSPPSARRTAPERAGIGTEDAVFVVENSTVSPEIVDFRRRGPAAAEYARARSRSPELAEQDEVPPDSVHALHDEVPSQSCMMAREIETEPVP